MARLTSRRVSSTGGHTTGDVFRRLVAQSWASIFDQATRPFRFVLQTRACTDAIAGTFARRWDLRPDSNIAVLLDGRSVRQYVSRGLLRRVEVVCARTASVCTPFLWSPNRPNESSWVSFSPPWSAGLHDTGSIAFVLPSERRRPVGTGTRIE